MAQGRIQRWRLGLARAMDRLADSLETRRGMAVAVLLLAALHALFVAVMPAPAVEWDARNFDQLASALVAGQGYVRNGAPETAFMPGYPLFLAAVFTLFGHHYEVVRYLQAALVGIAAAVLFAVARRWFGRRAAALAFLLLGLLPAFFIYATTLFAEPLVLLVVATYLWVAARPVPSSLRGVVFWAAASGLVAALLGLFKPEFFLWVPLPALVAFARRARWSRIALALGVAATCYGAALAPWALRNRRAVGELILLSTAGGRTLWISAHRPALTEFEQAPFPEAYRRCEVPDHPRATDQCLYREATAMIEDHPLYYLRSAVSRVVHTVVGSHTEYLVGYSLSFGEAIHAHRVAVLVVKAGLLGCHAGFALGGLLGLAWLARRREWLFFAYLAAVKLAIHGLVFGTARYSLHLAPLFALGIVTLVFPPAPTAASETPGDT